LEPKEVEIANPIPEGFIPEEDSDERKTTTEGAVILILSFLTLFVLAFAVRCCLKKTKVKEV
jgi:hypothetical protein